MVITLDDLALFTYTHSNASDVWPMYLGQIKKFFPEIKVYMIGNNFDGLEIKTNKMELLIYDDEKPYYKQVLECLEPVKEKYLIYMQEDFILYNRPQVNEIIKYNRFIDESKYNFVRLIKSGENKGKKIIENLYEIPKRSYYIYVMQPTISSTEDLTILYKESKCELLTKFEAHIRKIIKKLKFLGTYVYAGEKKRGQNHWDSTIFPYIATAISSGQWNLPEYPELNQLFIEYGIDKNKRGIRKDINGYYGRTY
ncbi:MAG: hypothetical protein EAX96_20085 [Candidatus Lokiarchaeota archaeon]|nr:hypothetical protein [Candidatus Lokiarchaeota archaeon]